MNFLTLSGSYFALLLIGLSLGIPQTAVAASFVSVGDLTGGQFRSSVLGVSGDGSTVLGQGSGSNGPEAFTWDAVNGIRGFGRTNSSAWAASYDGQIVAGNAEGTGASFWDDTRAIQRLSDSDRIADFSFGISDDGTTIAGQGRRASDLRQEAWIWDAANGIRGLGTRPGSNQTSIALGISGDGSTVVGGGTSTLGFEAGSEAFLWDDNGLLGLGDLVGGDFWSRAYDASFAGSVVVGQATSAMGREAFLWDETNGMRGLGDFAGGAFESRATAVSGAGDIVVGFGTAEGRTQAFIWDEENGLQTVESFLEGLGLDLSGWQLTNATGISSDGFTIVGSGLNPNGQFEGWVATVPEPSATLLLGLGLALMSGKRKR